MLRRRPDARWRVAEADVADLAALQQRLIDAVSPLVRPGGVLVYSVCTLLAEEADAHRFGPGWTSIGVLSGGWEARGAQTMLLRPDRDDHDGMLLRALARAVMAR
ncbi:MAG: hypothetical protein R2705_03420 [Ilumatobacteraceae bacterium]